MQIIKQILVCLILGLPVAIIYLLTKAFVSAIVDLIKGEDK